MGQTDSQFKAFIRFILDDIKELQSEPDDAKRSAKIDKIIDNLQKTPGGLSCTIKRPARKNRAGLFHPFALTTGIHTSNCVHSGPRYTSTSGPSAYS